MSRLLALAAALLILAASGCGEPTIPEEEAYDPEKTAGTVDTSLSDDLQAKQEVVHRVLLSMQGESLELDSMADYHADVRWKETDDAFLEGTLGLNRWQFNGPPTGGDVPLVLFFDQDSTGENVKKVERVYTVKRAGGRWIISRK